MKNIIPLVEIRNSGKKGRGVFAIRDIYAGTVVEVSPVIVMTQEDRKLLDQTLLYNYIFEWGDDKSRCCMALGYVAMYNHSNESNCEYEMDFQKETMAIRAVRDILRNEELTINYNGDWNNHAAVWFQEEE